MKDTAIIIPVHNLHHLTDRCIRFIEEAAFFWDHKIQIIVVDNASDKSYRFENSYPMSMVKKCVIQNHRNRFYSAAINQGLDLAGGRFNVLLLNNDAYLPTRFFESLYETYAASDKIIGPMTDRCSGMQCYGRGEIHHLNKMTITFKPEDVLICQNSCKEVFEKRYTEVQWVNGFCIFIGQNALVKIPRLNEEEFPLSGEELDYCYRQFDLGTEILIDHHLFVHHMKGQTVNEDPALKGFWKEATELLYKKYPSRATRQTVPEVK